MKLNLENKMIKEEVGNKDVKAWQQKLIVLDNN